MTDADGKKCPGCGTPSMHDQAIVFTVEELFQKEWTDNLAYDCASRCTTLKDVAWSAFQRGWAAHASKINN